MSALEAIALLAAGLVAGFVNTLGGGGSLLTLPVLVLSGLTWDHANATGRVSVFFQTAAASLGFLRAQSLDVRELAKMAIPSALGTGLGTWLALQTSPKAFEPVALIGLGSLGAAMLLRPRMTGPPRGTAPRTLGERPWAYPLLFAAGVWAGFIQAGVGYVLLAIFGGVLNRDLVSGNALKSALVFIFAAVALTTFSADAVVDWPRGLTLAAGSVVGALVAVRVAIRATDRTLRLILLGSLGFLIVASILR